MKTNYTNTTVTVNDILDENKFIVPTFQRNVVWKMNRRKEFIDTIRRGDPFGVILIQNNGGKYQLIDGLQRVTTIKDFCQNPFKYLSPNDINEENVQKLVKRVFELHKLSLENNTLDAQVEDYKKDIFEQLKAHSKTYQVIAAIRNKYGIPADDEVDSNLDSICEKFKKDIDISQLQITAINYIGPSENIPNVFYNLNTGGEPLSKYETYAALWSNIRYVIDDESILQEVIEKYNKLTEDSDLDVDFNEDQMLQEGITLFEYCYAISGIIHGKDLGFNTIMGSSSKTTDPMGFEVLTLLFDENVNKAERLEHHLSKAPSGFLINLKTAIVESLTVIKNALNDTIKGMNGTYFTSDRTYLMYHILISYMKEYYYINHDNYTISKKENTLSVSAFKKFLPYHFVYDTITEFWQKNRQVADLTRLLNSREARSKYWSNIPLETWEKGLDEFFESQELGSKSLSIRSKLFIDFYYKLKLESRQDMKQYFQKTWREENINLDFEHIVPKKTIESHISDLGTSEQKVYPVSAVGNICYLATSDNRSKRDKTLYDYKDNSPSFSLDNQYLDFLGYPRKEDLLFLNYDNNEFRKKYVQFLRNRAYKMKDELLDILKNRSY